MVTTNRNDSNFGNTVVGVRKNISNPGNFMTDETSAPAGGESAPVIAITAPANTGDDLSISQAARALTAGRARPPEPSAESAEPAPADPELSDEGNAAPAMQATGETQEDAPAEVPPRELPRSWTRDRTEVWNRLDPATQDILLEQDRMASAEVRRVQNEAAEFRKAAQAERAQAEQARQRYEAQLPALLQSLQDANQAAFSDIRTVDDVQKLASEDPFRYLQWQAHQTKLQAVSAEAEKARGQQDRQRQSEWQQYRQREDALAAELIPELADKDKGVALMKRAADRLTELGFRPDELTRLANGEERISVFDHRFQQLVYSDLKLSEIQNARTAVAQKPVPPVQRPGTARPQGQANSERIQALTQNLNATGSLRAAQELRAAQLRSRSRA
jgi:hypothetical protein